MFAASDELILCEALIDALTFWCAGYRHVTSSYGAGGFTDELLEAITGHGVKRVLIAYDRDAAGDKGAAVVAEALAGRGMAAFRVNFPKGMDANAYAMSVKPAAKSLGALSAGGRMDGRRKRSLETPPGGDGGAGAGSAGARSHLPLSG